MSSKKLVNGVSSGCLSIFGLPFLAAGVFLSWLYFTPYCKYVAAQSWEEVPCRIDSATLEVNHDSDGDTYKCLASYRYEYAGRSWTSDRVSLHGGGDNIGDFQHKAHRELSQYVAGKPAEAEWAPPAPGTRMFRCYVNPNNPAESVLYRDLRWQMLALIAIFALTFPAVGAGLVFGGLIGMLKTRRLEMTLGKLASESVANEFTTSPAPLIPESGSTSKIVLGIYTVWAAIVIAPLMVCAIACGALHETPAAAFLIIYPLLWSIPAWFSFRHLRQYLLIGRGRFQAAGAPAVVGERLEGHVLLEKTPPMRGTVELTLECTRLVTRKSSDGDSTSSETVWSEREEVTSDAFSREVTFTRIPVNFALPADAPPSGPSGQENTEHAWTLRLRVPGSPVNSVFDIPVASGGHSAEVAKAAPNINPPIPERTFAMLPDLLAARRIRAEFSANGTPVSLVCPPARNRSMLVFFILFNLVWTGFAFILVRQNAPMMFQIIWPGTAALIWLSIIRMLLHKRTVTLNATGLMLINQLGPFLHTRVFEKNRIRAFSHDTNMSSNNTNFYRVRLEYTGGKKATIADNITESATAEALAMRLNDWRKSG